MGRRDQCVWTLGSEGMMGHMEVGKDQLGEGMGFYSEHSRKPLEGFKQKGLTLPPFIVILYIVKLYTEHMLTTG